MKSSGELRQNVLTGHWIAVAPDRGGRPVQTGPERPDARPERPHDPDCPFCPGNESELPAILFEAGDQDEEGAWHTRAVPNKYPAFTNDPARGEWVDAGLGDGGSGIGKTLTLGSDVPVQVATPLPAVGYQEVIIESPRHDRDIPDMTDEAIGRVVDTYHARYISVSESAPSCRVFLFRNRGRAAGNSLEHPHAQLIATTVVPPEVRVREIRMLGYQGDHGRCLICALPEMEDGWRERVVAENDRYTAMVPWAAETPFEVWILPRHHQAEFGETDADERRDLAGILGTVLRAYRDHAGDPSYNLMIHSPRRSRSGSRAFHWFVQIRPRESQLAGFELASGIAINASTPERDAAILRGEDPEEGSRARAGAGAGEDAGGG